VLGISLRQFRRLVDGGRIAFVKVSERTPRVRPSELQRFLDASAVKYSEVQS
jgi:excisionase family DNA binding protein